MDHTERWSVISYKVKYWREYYLAKHKTKHFGGINIGDLDKIIPYMAFMLVGQFALGNTYACLRVAGGWLSLTITIITAYLKTSNSCVPR